MDVCSCITLPPFESIHPVATVALAGDEVGDASPTSALSVAESAQSAESGERAEVVRLSANVFIRRLCYPRLSGHSKVSVQPKVAAAREGLRCTQDRPARGASIGHLEPSLSGPWAVHPTASIVDKVQGANLGVGAAPTNSPTGGASELLPTARPCPAWPEEHQPRRRQDVNERVGRNLMDITSDGHQRWAVLLTNGLEDTEASLAVAMEAADLETCDQRDSHLCHRSTPCAITWAPTHSTRAK